VPAEFEGKNVAQAVDNACQALGIDKTRLIYEIVCQGSSGIFGLVGIRKARIRVAAAEPTASSPTTGPGKAITDSPLPTEAENAVQTPAETAGLDRQRIDAARNAGHQALQRIVAAITDGAQVTTLNLAAALHFNISGGNRGLLIGKHGQTLDAIQYLADKIVNRGNAERVRIHVDVEGYQEKRGQQLTDMALRLAAKARRSGRPQRLEPMNAYDRRLVHLALKSDAHVRTQSVGDGGQRALIIYPRLAAAGKAPTRPQAIDGVGGSNHANTHPRRTGKKRSG